MDFQQFAGKETSGLLERLTAAAAAQAEDARQRARDEAQRTIDAVSAEKQKLDASLKELRASLKDVQAEAEHLRSKLQSTERTRDEETRAKTTAEGELKKARAAVTEHEHTRRDLDSKLSAAIASEKSLKQKLGDIEKQLNRSEQDIEVALQEAEAARAETVAVRAQADAAVQAAMLREQKARSAPQPLDRLLTVFNHIAKSTTIGEVVTGVVQGLATEFSRVAAFSVGGNHLEGLHQVGFDFKNDISKVNIPLTMDSLLTQAATSGRVQGFVGKELSEGSIAPFTGHPAFVLTLPIAVRGETLAVVYADTGDQKASSGAAQRGVKFAELLLWHAVPMVGKLSVDHDGTRELRKYATLLLGQTENMFEADAKDGMDEEELRTRLNDNLDCARKLYAQRVAAANVPAATALLDEQVAALVSERGDTTFGRNLAAVAGTGSVEGSRSTRDSERRRRR